MSDDPDDRGEVSDAGGDSDPAVTPGEQDDDGAEDPRTVEPPPDR